LKSRVSKYTSKQSHTRVLPRGPEFRRHMMDPVTSNVKAGGVCVKHTVQRLFDDHQSSHALHTEVRLPGSRGSVLVILCLKIATTSDFQPRQIATDNPHVGDSWLCIYLFCFANVLLCLHAPAVRYCPRFSGAHFAVTSSPKRLLSRCSTFPSLPERSENMPMRAM
jgi:hypothetical protein